jgi:hypothetical protein
MNAEKNKRSICARSTSMKSTVRDAAQTLRAGRWTSDGVEDIDAEMEGRRGIHGVFRHCLTA